MDFCEFNEVNLVEILMLHFEIIFIRKLNRSLSDEDKLYLIIDKLSSAG